MKSKYSIEEWEKIVKEYHSSHSTKDITQKYGISKSTLYEWCIKITSISRKYGGKTYSNTEIYNMERRLKRLEIENKILKDSDIYLNASSSDRYNAIIKMKDKYPLFYLLSAFNYNKGSYYNKLLHSPKVKMRDQEKETYSDLISKYFQESKGRFGPAKICILLRKDGYKVTVSRVSKIMKELDLVAKLSLKPLPQVHRNFKYRVNRLQSVFTKDEPNKTWVSDITYVFVKKQMVGIIVIIDLFSRKVIAHAVAESITAAFLIDLFDKAFNERGCPKKLTFHSDQGTQYTAYEFRHYLKKIKVIQSFSNPGCPTDNAVAESFFSCMKREELAHNYYSTIKELENVVDDYINFFNNLRPHRTLKNVTPSEYEENFLTMDREIKIDDDIIY